MASNEKADIDLILRKIYAVESDGWAHNLDNPKKTWICPMVSNGLKFFNKILIWIKQLERGNHNWNFDARTSILSQMTNSDLIYNIITDCNCRLRL